MENHAVLIVSGGEGSVIKLTFAEALFDKNGRKGNRNDVGGREFRGYHDIFLPEGPSLRRGDIL